MHKLMDWDLDTLCLPRPAALPAGRLQLPLMEIPKQVWTATSGRAVEESHTWRLQTSDRGISRPGSNSYREAPDQCPGARNSFRRPVSEKRLQPDTASSHPKRWNPARVPIAHP